MDKDKTTIAETGRPEQGRVLMQFEIDESLKRAAVQYVMNSKTLYESQRYAAQEQDTNRKVWRDRLIQSDRAYRAILEPDRNYKGFSDKASPIINNNVEMIVARLKESILFNRKDKLVALESNLPTQAIREQQLNLQIEKQEIDSKVERFCRTLVKFGTAWLKVPLLQNEKTVLTQQLVTKTIQTPIIDDNNQPILGMDGKPQFHVEQKSSIETIPQIDKKYFGPGYVVVEDIERVYADVFIEDPQDQPIIIEEVIVSWDHLHQGITKGIYDPATVAKIKDKTWQGEGLSIGTFGASRSERVFGSSGLMFNNNNIRMSESKPKEYRMYQAWCDFNVPIKDENGNTEYRIYPVVISVISNEIVGFIANPYFHQMKPFIKAVYKRIEGECYGQSAIDPVLSLYHAYNDTFNQIEDNKVLKLNGITITKVGNVADKQDFNVGAGEVWFEKETGDIRPYSIDFPMAEGVQYLNQLEEQINKGMGINALMQGGASDSTDADKTWRGITKVIAEGDKVFKNIAKNIEDACIRQWAEMALKLNIQFFPIPMGMETFETINSESNIKVFGVESYFEKKENAEKLINFATQVAQIPGFNIVGLAMAVKDMMGLDYDEQKYGPLYQPPQPPPPEHKPMNMSVNIPLDPSKGQWMGLAAAQLLQKKEGIEIDIDGIMKAQALLNAQMPQEMQDKSGTLPPQMDSYRGTDKRTKKNIAKKDVKVVKNIIENKPTNESDPSELEDAADVASEPEGEPNE